MRHRSRPGLPAAILLASSFGCASAPMIAPTMERAAAATYVRDDGSAVELVDGRFEDAADHVAVALIPEFALAGDLDGDGADELVVLLTENAGGSGVFTYLAALPATSGELTAPLAGVGDRVALRGWQLEGDVVRVDVVQAGNDDAMCCPGELATRRWRLRGDRLVEEEAQVTGRLGLDAVAGDWRLVAWDIDAPLAADAPGITLQLAADQLSGSSGCNRYTGAVAGGAGAGSIAVGPIAGTRMACPEPLMDAESRYLGALGGASKVGFYLGLLAISYQAEGAYGTLLFEASSPSP